MIIKCPECGHQVSDKAPVCPSCGVEIAGHIIKCSHCGELYLIEEPSCPNCHHTETDVAKAVAAVEKVVVDAPKEANSSSAVEEITEGVAAEEVHDSLENTPSDEPIVVGLPAEEPTTTDADDEEDNVVDAAFIMDNDKDTAVLDAAERLEEEASERQEQEQSKKHNHTSLAVSLLIAVITAAVLLFLYNQGVRNNKTNDEQEEYAQAMASSEPTVMQNYLKQYPDAPKAHRDSVSLRIKALHTTDTDWASVAASNSKEAMQAYLSKHPNSPHKQELQAKIDEMDWATAVKKNDEDAYAGYLAMHQNGAHAAEADAILKKLMKHTVADADKSSAVNAVRQLLQGINSKSNEKIAGAVASQLNFLGSAGSTAKDIQSYMHNRLYQADVKTVNWHLGSPAEVTKDSNDDDAPLKIKVPATLSIEREGGTSNRKYMISAVVKGGRITQINWN